VKYYTGIGSRETPAVILDLMQEVAYGLALAGYTLRSGGAKGADTAFERGSDRYRMSQKEIYIPWKGFNGETGGIKPLILNELGYQFQAEQLASTIHPNWNACSQGAKLLHTRNVYQVLGQDIDYPSKFLLCYAQPTPNGVKGGTNTAVQIAYRYDVPVFNLYFDEVVKRFESYVDCLNISNNITEG
jgi:hypothetical protein